MFGFIAISWAITFGVVPTQIDAVGKSHVAIGQIGTFSELEVAAVAWDRLTVYGSVETYQHLNSGKISFSPYRADYVFGAELKITDGLKIGLEHECDHPVASGIDLSSGVYKSEYNYGSSETRVFVKVGGGIK